ncbi:STAS domain-containing protein [Serratia sp. UGAL515B_01]|uniref:STAS domain-containing protein n=1 Tax=Serratia sp. UGAL515B_01 TaxID=2986763 RepID=UPI002953ED57|nr:STAS domain-containing protein [Serratia sp. UGAL515B_01]WON75857.1 STAS domain-containing protein [Serratia sp. UGAL515B_01]
MNFEIQSENGVEIITPLVRRLDASVAGIFKQDILSFIQQGKNSILLDFSQVDFIDSSCLGALVSMLKMLNERGDLALCSLNSNIQNMFKLTRMDRIFTIGSDREAALEIMNR